jgi:hypothetical protein
MRLNANSPKCSTAPIRKRNRNTAKMGMSVPMVENPPKGQKRGAYGPLLKSRDTPSLPLPLPLDITDDIVSAIRKRLEERRQRKEGSLRESQDVVMDAKGRRNEGRKQLLRDLLFKYNGSQLKEGMARRGLEDSRCRSWWLHNCGCFPHLWNRWLWSHHLYSTIAASEAV